MHDPHVAYRLTCIGNICVQWSALEHQAACVIWSMLDINEGTGRFITGGMDLQPRLNVAIRIATHLGAPKEVLTDLKEVRKQVQDGLDIIRNHAVHGVTFFSPDGRTARIKTHRGKKAGEYELSNSELKAAGTAINQLVRKLGEVNKAINADHDFLMKATMARKTLKAT